MTFETILWPALGGAAIGLVLGMLIAFVIGLVREGRLRDALSQKEADVARLEASLKSQETLAAERDASFELARDRLTLG